MEGGFAEAQLLAVATAGGCKGVYQVQQHSTGQLRVCQGHCQACSLHTEANIC